MNTPKLVLNYPETRREPVIKHKETGASVREYRKNLGLSVRDVATETKLSASYISDLELGRRNWNEEKLKRIIIAMLTSHGRAK